MISWRALQCVLQLQPKLPKGYLYNSHCSMLKTGEEKTEGARIENEALEGRCLRLSKARPLINRLNFTHPARSQPVTGNCQSASAYFRNGNIQDFYHLSELSSRPLSQILLYLSDNRTNTR
jgi:hypothetical protein